MLTTMRKALATVAIIASTLMAIGIAIQISGLFEPTGFLGRVGELVTTFAFFIIAVGFLLVLIEKMQPTRNK